VFRTAKRLEIATVLVANQRLRAPVGNPHVTAVWVDGGADVADRYIAEHAEPGDLVVTQDIPLAALLVPKQVVVLDPRGEEHTAETIGERLSVRDFMDRLRMAGGVTGGPPTYDARARQAFYWLANIFLMTGRRCSIEGCDAPDGLAGLLWLAAMFGPPLYLTVRWARKRSQR